MNCNVYMFHKIIVSNKFSLFWTRTLFLYVSFLLTFPENANKLERLTLKNVSQSIKRFSCRTQDWHAFRWATSLTCTMKQMEKRKHTSLIFQSRIDIKM